MERKIDLGLLFSGTGTYCLLSRASKTGALRAIEQVNSDTSLDMVFSPIERDPKGNVDAYAPLCEEILRDSGARHVIGCSTFPAHSQLTVI